MKKEANDQQSPPSGSELSRTEDISQEGVDQAIVDSDKRRQLLARIIAEDAALLKRLGR